MLQAMQWRRVGGTRRRSMAGRPGSTSGISATRATWRNKSPSVAFDIDRQLASELDRRIAKVCNGQFGIVVVTDDRCLVVRNNQREGDFTRVLSNKLVGKNICDVIGSRASNFFIEPDASATQTLGMGTLSCSSVTPFEFSGRNWLLWELAVENVETIPSQQSSVSVQVDGVQLRFDQAETVGARRPTTAANVTRVDRGQAVLALEALAYRTAVKRMTSLIGHIDLLGLLTIRLERQLSAVSELQPFLRRAVHESKAVSESLIEMHALHHGYTAKLQWCELDDALDRCIAAVMHNIAGCDLKIKRHYNSRQHLIHVDKIAFSRAIFWMINTASKNLSKSDREMSLRSDFLGDELQLQVVYRLDESAVNAYSPAFGTLQLDDKINNHSNEKDLAVHPPLKARWAVQNRPDGFTLFEIFVQCNHKDL